MLPLLLGLGVAGIVAWAASDSDSSSNSSSGEDDARERRRIEREAEVELKKKKRLEQLEQLEHAYPDEMNSYLSSVAGNLQPYCASLSVHQYTKVDRQVLKVTMGYGRTTKGFFNAFSTAFSDDMASTTESTTENSVAFERSISALLYPNLHEKPFYKKTLENIQLIERLYQKPLQPNNSTLIDLKKTHELVQELAVLHALREALITNSTPTK